MTLSTDVQFQALSRGHHSPRRDSAQILAAFKDFTKYYLKPAGATQKATSGVFLFVC